MPGFDYKYAALTAYNIAKLISGSSWKYSYRQNALKRYDAETLAGFAEEFSKSLGLEEHLPAVQGFDTYVSNRTDNADKFTSVKVDGEVTFVQKLAVGRDASEELKTAALAVKASIKNALKLEDDTTAAQAKFKQHVENLKRSIADPDFDYNSVTLLHDLFSIKEEAVTAIKAQHAKELEELEATFETSSFKQNMKVVLGKLDEEEEALAEQLNKIKADMTEELKKKQTEELSTFEESVSGPITKSLEQAARRVSIAASLDQDKQNKAILANLMAQSDGDLTTRAGATSQEKSARYKDVNLEGLKEFFTATGTKVSKTGEYSFTIPFPNRILHHLYYLDPSHNRKADMMQTPMLLKAMGCDTVNIRVRHPNKEYEKILAREAYEACREAGFEPKDIKIQLGEETISDEKPGDIKRKLFSDCPSQYEACEKQAQKNAEVWKEIVNRQPRETIDSYKQHNTALRAAHEPPAQEIHPEGPAART